MVEYTIKAAGGLDCFDLKMAETKGFWSNYMILSKESGKFKELWFDEKFREKKLDVYCTCQSGRQFLHIKIPPILLERFFLRRTP